MAIEMGLAFDDVLLKPGYSDFTREDVSLKTRLTKRLSLETPFVSAPMDTVTDGTFAIAIAQMGGIGIIHRNLRMTEQAEEARKVKAAGHMVAAAVGVGEGYKERVEALITAGVDAVCVDAAHGATSAMVSAITYIKKTHDVEVIAGNIATYEGAKLLIEAGADALRVGMGPGSICTTRVVSGMGMPQFTAIQEAARAAREYDVPVIADGGIKYAGDIVKALAAGASTVMMGSYFAACEESPGEIVELTKAQVPEQFQHLCKGNQSTYKFKVYRGMGSVGAMQEGARINSEDEFHGKSFKDQVLVAEGVESIIPLKGTVRDIADQAIGGIRSGLFYVGAKNVAELQEKAAFVQLTAASLRESHPHGVAITNAGLSYS